MSKPTHVFVSAAPGRLCPIAPSDATAPGGRLLICTPDEVYRLPSTSYVRRRIAAGDLIVVPEPKTERPEARELKATKER